MRFAALQPMNIAALHIGPPPDPPLPPPTPSTRGSRSRQWLRTIGYAGIETAGRLRQAEIGLMSDGTLAARVPLSGGRGHRVYDEASMGLLGSASPSDYPRVAQRVRELIRHGAISEPIITPTAPLGWDARSAALTTASVMAGIRQRMMPGTGHWLQAFARGSELRAAYQGFIRAQAHLDDAVKQHSLYPNAPQQGARLAQATNEAVLATAHFLRAGGEPFERAARREVRQLADLARQLSLVGATAALGPLGGILQALGSRAFDLLTPGPRMYSSTGVNDVTLILTVLGAMKAGDVTHHWAQGAGAGPGVRIALGTLLHFLSDTVTETSGRVAQGLLDGETGPELWHHARAAFTGSGLASLVSSLTVEVLEHRTRIPKAQLVAWSESLERVFSRLGVYVATNQADTRATARAPGRPTSGTGPAANITVFDLLRIEANQQAPLYQRQQVPGLDFVRKVQSAAVRLGTPEALPASGVLESPHDVAVAMWAVLASKPTDAEKAAFLRHLLEGP